MGYRGQVEILKKYPTIYSIIGYVKENCLWGEDEDAVLTIFKDDKKFSKHIRSERIKLALGDIDELDERGLLKDFVKEIFKEME